MEHLHNYCALIQLCPIHLSRYYLLRKSHKIKPRLRGTSCFRPSYFFVGILSKLFCRATVSHWCARVHILRLSCSRHSKLLFTLKENILQTYPVAGYEIITEKKLNTGSLYLTNFLPPNLLHKVYHFL